MFEIQLGKRGGRLGWKEPGGEKSRYSALIGHSDIPGQIFWRELSADEASTVQAAKQKVSKTPCDLLELVPQNGTITKSLLIEGASSHEIGENRAVRFIKRLITDGKIHEVPVPRKGTRPEIHIARCGESKDTVMAP